MNIYEFLHFTYYLRKKKPYRNTIIETIHIIVEYNMYYNVNKNKLILIIFKHFDRKLRLHLSNTGLDSF